LISKIIAGAIVFLALAPQAMPIAQEAQKENLSVFLLRLKCVSTGVGNSARRREDISVGKAVYTSRLYIGPGDRFAGLTCQLQPNEGDVIFQKLRLSFGMRDNDQGSPAAVVNVYLDGVRAESRTVSPGQPASVSLDVTTTNNVSIEAVCPNRSRYCDRVYFWDASVEYPPVLPKSHSKNID
jgi:hypothetical protein